MKRTLSIIGEISDESLKEFYTDIALLESENSKPITVELCSAGGDTYAGLAYYGRLMTSPCEIVVKAYGAIMSAATVVLAAGDIRKMHWSAWFMVHEDIQETPSTAAAKHYLRLEKQWADILAMHSNQSTEFWLEAASKTTYLSAKECFQLGLVSELL
jgi:ATP-dependent protease ClpP protease subunit